MSPHRGRFALVAALILSIGGCHGCWDDEDDDDRPVVPPAAPTGLAVTLTTSGRIALAWTDNATNETGFRIERSPDGVTWTVVGTAAPDATTYVDRGLLPQTQYFYRVSATGNGGSAPAGPVNDTTLNLFWDATTVGGGPSARLSSTAIFDPGNVRMIVFGGDDGVFDVPSDTSLKNDAWALDLSTAPPSWSPLTVSGTPPPRRWLHTAVYDSFRTRMLVFGGDAGTLTNGIVNQNDVWELTLPAGAGTPTWTQLSPAVPSGAPPVRQAHSAVFDEANRRMIVMGGVDASILDDAWALDVDATADGTWIPLATAPGPRWMHSAVYDAVNQRMVVFGGQDNSTRLNDVLALSLPASAAASAWSTLLSSAASSIPARSAHSAVYDAPNSRMVVFGGDVAGPPSDETWILPLVGAPAFALTAPTGTPPPGRYSHAAAYDSLSERMIIFSGDDGSLFPIDDLAWALGF